MLEPYRQHCEKLQRTGNYRQLPDDLKSDDASHLDFSSNDYLGLSRHPDVLNASIDALKTLGVGATGSRLLSGNRDIFVALETLIARDKKTESALLFNSGFQANVSALSSLLNRSVLKKRPIVFFDKLNHASLYQAVFLSGAELVRYKHLDCDHLLQCLTQYKQVDRPKFIVTETLFGMDGDIVPLENILSLARAHQAFLYLDEAHALGVLGKRGYGLSTTLTHDVPTLVMGTLSKAVGCAGAYVAGSQILIDYLMNHAPGFIFSTAQSPLVIASALKAWSMIADFDEARAKLLAHADTLRASLASLGFNTGSSASHIIPIIIGQHELMYQLNRQLKNNDIRVSLIRRPTVPPGGERLRIALNVNHTQDALDQLVSALK